MSKYTFMLFDIVRWQWKKSFWPIVQSIDPLSPVVAFVSSSQNSMPILFLYYISHICCICICICVCARLVCKSFIILHKWFLSCLHNMLSSCAIINNHWRMSSWLSCDDLLVRRPAHLLTYPLTRILACPPASTLWLCAWCALEI